MIQKVGAVQGTGCNVGVGRMVRSWILAFAASAALVGWARADAPSRQAVYDAAQQAYDKKDWAAAAEGFVHLLPTDPSKALLKSEAVIATRYAAAELRLGRAEEASRWIDRALASASLLDVDNQAQAWLTKGDVERARCNLEIAVDAYDHADVLASPGGVSNLLVNARFGFAYAGVTLKPRSVSEKMEALLADPAFRRMADRATLADAEDLAARAAINAGDKPAATQWASKAVSDSGGLSATAVTYSDATIRADAGLIAKLRNDDEDAHKYFAYTGAGHLPDMSWLTITRASCRRAVKRATKSRHPTAWS